MESIDVAYAEATALLVLIRPKAAAMPLANIVLACCSTCLEISAKLICR